MYNRRVGGWRYRLLRHHVYTFLERPSDLTNLIYQLSILSVVSMVVVLGAIFRTDESMLLQRITEVAQVILAAFFAVEYGLRLWCASENAKWIGWKGKLRYLVRPLPVIDTIILIAALIQPFAPSDHRAQFLLALRILHIDRDAAALSVVERVLTLHKMELRAAYFLALITVLLMTAVVDWTEAAHGFDTFSTYAETLWWGVITMTTIGYGDISPTGHSSRLATGVLSIVCIALFGTAASIVGTGLTLMVNDNMLKKKQAKIRPLAAAVIQTFIRQHYMRRKFDKFAVYREKLYNRLLAYEKATTQLTPNTQLSLLSPLTGQSFRLRSNSIKLIDSALMEASSLWMNTHRRLHQRHLGGHDGGSRGTGTHSGNEAHVVHGRAPNITITNATDETSPSKRQKLASLIDSNAALSHKRAPTPLKYRLALYALWRFRFASACARLARARKPYSFEDVTIEVSDNEQTQMQKLREIGASIEATAGRSGRSRLTAAEGQNVNGTDSLSERLAKMTQKMADLQRKSDEIEKLTLLIASNMNSTK